MPERAKVTSVEAIEGFRASLVLFLGKARPALEEVGGDVLRTRVWLEEEQVTYWQNQLRVRSRAFQEAQQALFSAKLSNLRTESAAEVLAVQRAKRQLEEAQAKLRVIRVWARSFDNRVQPLLKQVEKLHTVLAHDMVKGVAYLADIVKTLDAYAEITPPVQAPATASASGNAQPASGAGAVREGES